MPSPAPGHTAGAAQPQQASQDHAAGRPVQRAAALTQRIERRECHVGAAALRLVLGLEALAAVLGPCGVLEGGQGGVPPSPPEHPPATGGVLDHRRRARLPAPP
jgi:hypothetical protein